jgi:hypothetical protein
MFSLKNNKAPGPDGFNAGFFKRMWHIVGEDVINAVRSFFQTRRMLKEMNATSISLIPKVANPTRLTDFRPISCCNTVYKCIAKILAGRIKVVLPSLVGPYQTAFISGRRISDNILLSQELMKGYHKSTGPARCAMKVDLMKAYDSVRWDFVDAMLIKMGFPRTVIDWIMVCVTSCQFSINVNGELAGYFQGGRGLRQGDPLSPYLFVLCMEILSGLFCKMSANQEFKFHWRCKKDKISHLCFADDLMIFSNGDVNSIRMIRTVLTKFQDLSGLYPNPNKSDIFLSGVLNAEREQIIHILGFREGELPMKYLGVPLLSSRLKAIYCKGLVDRITSKVRHWTCRTLSYAGRVQLINSVLFSIQVYWASLFLLPGQVIKNVEQIMKSFLWSGSDMRTTGAKVAWDQVCLPKKEGGLGIKSITEWNKIALLKHIWNLCNDSDGSIWSTWIRSNLLRGRNFWTIKTPQNCSWAWGKILKLRSLAWPKMKYIIGDGMTTSLWFDNWHPHSPLADSYGERFIYDSGMAKNAKVNVLIQNSEWKTPTTQAIGWHPIIEAIPSNSNPKMGQKDEIVWLDSPNHRFSVKVAWEQLRRHRQMVEWHDIVWFKNAVPRHSFLLWMAVQQKLTTQDKLHRFGIHGPNRCSLCLRNNEDHNHLFFECSYTKAIWWDVCDRCDIPRMTKGWDEWIRWATVSWHGKSFVNFSRKLSFAATVYHVWQERNARIFAGMSRTPNLVLNQIECIIRDKLDLMRNVVPTNENTRIQRAWRVNTIDS